MKDDGSKEILETKNILIATGSEVVPLSGVEALLLRHCFSTIRILMCCFYIAD